MEDAIEEVGVGRTQWMLLFICGLTFCSDAAEITFLSYVLVVLKCEWNLTSQQESNVASAVFIGMIIGSPLWGRISDKTGRRIAFLLSSAVITFFGFATALSWNYYSLVCIRAIVGVGIAGLPIGFDILAEALPKANRGSFLLYIEYFWTLGSIYVNMCAWLTLGPHGHWQLFTILAAIPTLISFIAGYIWLPESPRWLADESRPAEALSILNTWAARNGCTTRFESIEPPAKAAEVNIIDLCKNRKYLGRAVLMSIVWMAFGVAYYGIVMLLPRLLQEQSDDTGDDASSSCLIKFDFHDLVIVSLSEILGVIGALLLIDRAGRTWTQGLSYALGAVAALLLGNNEFFSLQVLMIVASVGRMAQMSASCATWVHTPELFPTSVRGTAHTLLNLFSKVGAALSQYLISDIFTHFQRSVIMALFSLSAAVASMFLHETAGEDLADESDDDNGDDKKPLK